MAVEEHFDVDIPDEEAVRCKTVMDAVDLVERLLKGMSDSFVSYTVVPTPSKGTTTTTKITAEYQLCSKCKGEKVIHKGHTYGYAGSFVRLVEHDCPRCGGTGIELIPAKAEEILAELKRGA